MNAPADPSQSPTASTPNPPPKPAKRIRFSGTFVEKLIIIIVIALAAAGLGYVIGHKIGYDAGNTYSKCISATLNCDSQNQPRATVDEPVIYLYPQKTETVNVRVSYPAGFTYTKPKYNSQSGWNVQANPNGSLINLTDNKQFPYLIWEGNRPPIQFDMQTGFVVRGTDTDSFLKHELPLIGLSSAETAAFIAYWQPRMAGNKYNLIHFAGKEYADYAKLTVTPQPDSELRVLMVYKSLQQSIPVQPQTFPPFQRQGFTVVEWGGTQL